MKLYTIRKTTLSSCGWAMRMGISRQAMYSRIKKADSAEELEEALTTPGRQGFRSDKQTDEPIPDNVVKLPVKKK